MKTRTQLAEELEQMIEICNTAEAIITQADTKIENLLIQHQVPEEVRVVIGELIEVRSKAASTLEQAVKQGDEIAFESILAIIAGS